MDIEINRSGLSVSIIKVLSSGVKTIEFVFQFDSQLCAISSFFFQISALLALSRPWKVQTCTEQQYSTVQYTTKTDTAQ